MSIRNIHLICQVILLCTEKLSLISSRKWKLAPLPSSAIHEAGDGLIEWPEILNSWLSSDVFVIEQMSFSWCKGYIIYQKTNVLWPCLVI